MARKNASPEFFRQNRKHATVLSCEVENGQMTVRFRLSQRPHSRKPDKNIYTLRCADNEKNNRLYYVQTQPDPNRWRM